MNIIEANDYLNKVLIKKAKLDHLKHIVNYDLETVCSINGKLDESELLTYLSLKTFKLTSSKKYIKVINFLNDNLEKLDPLAKRLVYLLHKSYKIQKNLSSGFVNKMNSTFNKAGISWLKAKEQKSYELFRKDLEKIVKVEKEYIKLKSGNFKTNYDSLLDEYEENMNEEILDQFFADCKKRIIPLLEAINNSKVEIRTDFMNRKVPIYLQENYSKILMNTLGLNLNSSAINTSEHPFTDQIAKNDTRITTHYFENNFISNIYSVIHETGHAIFAQNQDPKDFEKHLDNNMSLGMHESVSRFYENRIGRSEGFIKNIIYPDLLHYFPNIFDDISKDELYLAINKVTPSLIRTEADELTYTLHIIIRYEIEKDLVNKKVNIKNLNKLWNDKYYEYLKIRPTNDKEGILQDIHWTSGFGYFPTYALGNAFNSMYYKVLTKDIDINKCYETRNLSAIREWLKQNVFKDANHFNSQEWITKITNAKFSADDFLTYLEEKYSKIYNL